MPNPLAPDGKVQPPGPPLGPTTGPEGAADDDADRAPEPRRQGEEQAEAVDAERADGPADGIAEEGVLVLGRLHHVALGRVRRRENQRPVQRQRERGREEEGHGQHVRWIVVEVQVLVARVRHPIEMAHDAVGEAVSPGAHQYWPDHDKREVREDGEAEGERHVVSDAELAADLDLTQRPCAEGAQRANRDELPQPALLQRRETQPVAEIRRGDADLPEVPRRPDRGAIHDQRGAEGREEDRHDAEEPDVERPDPEIEEIATDQSAAANAVLPFKAQHGHSQSPSRSRSHLATGIARYRS